MKQLETMPAFTPIESPRADLLTKLIEQIKYERTDGSQLPVRVVLSNEKAAHDVIAECFVEESQDASTEFSYSDFLSMLHKRVRAKGANK